jgi:hypothetical protein
MRAAPDISWIAWRSTGVASMIPGGGAKTRQRRPLRWRVRTRTGLKFLGPGSSRGRWKGWSLLDSVELALPAIRDARGDAVTAAALSVVRRALVEGVPVTREGLAQEASFALGGSTEDALRHVDDVAQRLGVSSLS